MTATASTLRDLLDLVERLRAPDGCPWDRAQTLADVRAFLVEEAHEVAAAIDDHDWESLAGELGDLLFQAAFVARLAEEAGRFTAEDSISASHRKMVDRHPHVFASERQPDADAVHAAWERRKVAGGRALLDGVPPSLPALVAAFRMSQKAAGIGFDWPDRSGVLAKVEEELEELRETLDGDDAAARNEQVEELGDLLFALASLARHLRIDPEAALNRANAKFRRRFAHVEGRVATAGKTLGEVSLGELERYWQDAKS